MGIWFALLHGRPPVPRMCLALFLFPTSITGIFFCAGHETHCPNLLLLLYLVQPRLLGHGGLSSKPKPPRPPFPQVAWQRGTSLTPIVLAPPLRRAGFHCLVRVHSVDAEFFRVISKNNLQTPVMEPAPRPSNLGSAIISRKILFGG